MDMITLTGPDGNEIVVVGVPDSAIEACPYLLIENPMGWTVALSTPVAERFLALLEVLPAEDAWRVIGTFAISLVEDELLTRNATP